MSTEIQVDDETRAALLLFNERVEATAAKERGRKRVAKAERAKDEAAKKVRKLSNDADATAEQKAEAEAEYKAASDHFQVVQANPNAADRKPAKKEAPEAESALDETADAVAAPADEETPSEVSADEEPATQNAPVAAEAPSEGE